MRVVIQRVSKASVTVDNKLISEIDQGLLVLLGIHEDDTTADRDYLIKKLLHLRIFSDDEGRMNKNVQDVGGSLIVVSQFTLYGNCKKGNRPSFVKAMHPDRAQPMYEDFVKTLSSLYPSVHGGVFGANMQVALINDGPVTIVLESSEHQ